MSHPADSNASLEGSQSGESSSSSSMRPRRPPAIHVEDATVLHPSYHRSNTKRHPADEDNADSKARSTQPSTGPHESSKIRARSQSTTGHGSKGRIGQYEILQTLGTGSFSKVKLAVHSATGHKVAMKIIDRAKLQGSGDMGARVKREIQYLKVLRHPHIIKLYEVITTPTDIIMVIEYAGGELFNYIVERGRMPEDEARRFFQQIICAIEYTHERKIVHRDLKPENLLLDEFLNVKIADFGLSNSMLDGSFMSTSCGSPNYAAPEVISGKLYAGPEIDIWSCGVILYVMLCGRLPFDDEYIPTLFKKINGGIYSLPTFLSPEARHLLSAMLGVDPVKRITIQEIRALPWFQKNLPDYLRPLPRADDEDRLFEDERKELAGGESESQEQHSFKLDQSIIDELETKMKGTFSREELVSELMRDGTNQVKISYQLVRDHRRMVTERGLGEHKSMAGFLSKSPPGWNEGSRQDDPRGNTLERDARAVTAQQEPQVSEEVQSSNIAVLNSSLPGHAKAATANKEGKATNEQPGAGATTRGHEDASIVDETQAYGESHRGGGDDKSRSRGGSGPTGPAHISGSAMPATPAGIASGVPPGVSAMTSAVHRSQSAARRAHRPRWHFGIRSRSPPMEVMGEIYRVLGTLGMEWKTRKRSGAIAEANDEAAVEDPYFIQARVRVRDVTIRLDLQLYQVEEGSYLVDFKHVSNPRVRGTSEPAAQQQQPPPPGQQPQQEVAASTTTPAQQVLESAGPHPASAAGSTGGTPTHATSRSRRSSSNAHHGGAGPRSGAVFRFNSFGESLPTETHTEMDVVSPFLFFEIATRLITELAVAA